MLLLFKISVGRQFDPGSLLFCRFIGHHLGSFIPTAGFRQGLIFRRRQTARFHTLDELLLDLRWRTLS